MLTRRLRSPALFVAIASCLLPMPAIAEHLPITFDGYVTNIVSPMEFDVGKRHVLCDDKTTWQRNSTLPPFLTELRVGIPIHVDGEFRDHNHKRTFVATNVHPNPTLMSAPDGQMQGRGLIYQDVTLHPDGTGILWLDGYPLHITLATKFLGLTGTPIQTDHIMPNQWAAYQAERGENAALVATSITFTPNTADQDEEKFREDTAPRPTPADPLSQTPGELKLGGKLGVKLEILSDAEVQAYVSNVGNSLIPRYQKDLPDTDPTKINFRFYVIRHRSVWKGTLFTVLDLPDGSILVPDTALVALENEAQLAARLSSCIADVLEKQVYLHRTRLRVQGDTQLASDLAGLYGLPVSIPNGITLDRLIEELNERADRIGLIYMLQQGYDIRQAPFAWEIGANQEVHNPLKPGVPVPSRAAALMEVLHLDYATTNYSTLRTDREAFAAMQARLRAADDKLPKPKNYND